MAPNHPAPTFGIGNRIAPLRFIAFATLAIVGGGVGSLWLGWRHGVMAGFDLGALTFLLSCIPLLNNEAAEMRAAAKRNDANRAALLAITGGVMAVILVAVASEFLQKQAAQPFSVVLILATLILAWLFSNIVYALHYAHMFYSSGTDGKDEGGLDFPGTKEPDYWDFIYFSVCLGMTFQTSDVEMTNGRFRRVSTFHCLAAFVFNLGVLAFSINILGS
jgi:uncharacterized membrane protein